MARFMATCVRFQYHHFFAKRTKYVDPKGETIRVHRPGYILLGTLGLGLCGGVLYLMREAEIEIE
jgi:hypothetical protein